MGVSVSTVIAFHEAAIPESRHSCTLQHLQLWVYPNKGTKRDIGLSLISDAHNCLPAGFELACNG